MGFKINYNVTKYVATAAASSQFGGRYTTSCNEIEIVEYINKIYTKRVQNLLGVYLRR